LRIEYLCEEVLSHRATVAVEFSQGRFVVGTMCQGHGREPQTSRPTLCAGRHICHLRRRQLNPHGGHQVPRLRCGEGQVGQPDLDDGLRQPVPVEWKQRICPAQEDQVQTAARVAKDVVDPRCGGGGQGGVAVQDERHWGAARDAGGQLGEEEVVVV
jgi:hypothetical protein